MADIRDQLLDLDKELTERLTYIGGCGDGNCLIIKPIGQHTNGGCRCSYDRMKMQRFASAMNIYHRQVMRLVQDSQP